GVQDGGGGIAGAAGEAVDGTGEGATVFAGDGLKGGERVGHHELRQGDGGVGARDERGGGSAGGGLGKKVVSVAPVGAERHEHLAGAQGARVHGEAGDRHHGNRRPVTGR